jgi:hypothetical protein
MSGVFMNPKRSLGKLYIHYPTIRDQKDGEDKSCISKTIAD